MTATNPKPEHKTLREFFEDCYRPARLFANSEQTLNTIDSYRQILCVWEQLLEVNPRLIDINSLVLADYRDELCTRPWREEQLRSPNTVRKHMRHINALLNFAGPSVRGCRDALGIIKEVPWVKSPREIHRHPVVAKLVSIQKLFGVFDEARLPTGDFWPGDWWRAYYMLALNTSCRHRTLIGFRWDYVKDDRLVVPGERTKGRKDLVMPLLPQTAAAIDAMRGFDDTLILPHHEQHPSSLFSENWRLNELAGLAEEDRVTSHRVRRFVLTQLSISNPVAAQQAASHSSFKTTVKSYLDNQIMTDAVKQLDLCQRAIVS